MNLPPRAAPPQRDGWSASDGGGDPSGWPPPEARPSSLPGCGTIIAVLALGVFVLLIVGAIALQVMFSGMGAAPTSRPAPVSWTARDVGLDPAHPRVEGRVVVAWRETGDQIAVGVNAGVPVARSSAAVPAPSVDASARPSTAATVAPGATAIPAIPMVDPGVRLSVRGDGFAQTCDAPCEIPLPSPAECRGTEPCRAEYAIVIELADVASARSLTVAISAGASAPMEGRLPDGLSVSLELGGAVPPSPGG